jgi:DNA (cytosine-5)-methyltransferase 1
MPAQTATRTEPAPHPAAAFTLPPIVRAARSLGIRFVDLFCGAGGSSTGLVEAGFELLLAVNHWETAVRTHAENHPGAEHWCEDIDRTDMRRLPRGAEVLWGSPICTEGTPAGGNSGRRSKRSDGQEPIEELGHVPQPGFERTRATFWDILRATEVRRHAGNPFLAVVVENVPDLAWRWELLDLWCLAMMRFGYRMQILSASSAHLGDEQGNDPAPQWRDRAYFVFVLEHLPQPDLAPRPTAWCPVCEADVAAVQHWKPAAPDSKSVVLGQRIGKYRQQYTYVCPRQHAQVEPYVRPAASVIDWSDLGERIGDRRKPLAASTMARIRAGLAKYPASRTVITTNHDGHDGRAIDADTAPLPTRSTKIGEGILVPSGGTWNQDATSTSEPFRTRMANPKGYEALASGPEPLIVEYRNHADAEPVTAPMATVTAQGNHHALVVPDGAIYVKNYGGNARPNKDMSKPVTVPLGTLTATDHHALVVPYRNGTAKPARQPLLTLATRDSAALAVPAAQAAVHVEDCTFRMLGPREQLGAQRFPTDYRVHGNLGQQTAQAGNAVSVNAARFIGERLAPVLVGA